MRPRNRSPPRAALRCPRARRVKWLRASPGSAPVISQGRGSRGHTRAISVTGTNRSNRPRSAPSTKIPARACPAASMTGPPLWPGKVPTSPIQSSCTAPAVAGPATANCRHTPFSGPSASG